MLQIYKIKKKSVYEKRVVKIYCNKCGKKIKRSDNGFYDHLNINKKWGYFSPYDNEVHKFQICQKCYKEIIKSFKIPIKKI